MKPLLYLLAYCIWIPCFRLVSLTFLTYFLISPSSKFQDVSDAFSSNEVTVMGLSALIFVALIYALFPLKQSAGSGIVDREKIEKHFLPGFLRGAAIAGSVVAFMLLVGIYKYLGSFIQFSEAPIAITNISLRMLALCTLAYCEAYIFHEKVAGAFRQTSLSGPFTACLIGLLYCSVKALQFDLGLAQLFTLFLIAISQHLRMLRDGTFARAAGLWAALLVIFNPVLSLPIFGNDFSGILLIKFIPPTESATFFATNSAAIPGSILKLLGRLFSGGIGGPLSSFVFQVLLILDITLIVTGIRKRSSP